MSDLPSAYKDKLRERARDEKKVELPGRSPQKHKDPPLEKASVVADTQKKERITQKSKAGRKGVGGKTE